YVTEDPEYRAHSGSNQRGYRAVTMDLRTTEEVAGPPRPHVSRIMWEELGRPSSNPPSPFPQTCPRCNAWRNAFTGREIIEPVRTKGQQSIGVLLEDAFRLQPPRASKQKASRAV